jgi:mannitol/fructose-specific phosphotransferase system IIA component
MPLAAISAYLERLPARQAELKLLLSDAVSIPHMKENHREAAQSAWMRAAMIEADNSIKPASPARLKLMGIGVRHVDQ